MAKINTNSKHGLSLLKSFQICRPKNPSSMIKTPSPPASSGVLDISFPHFPDPPPSMITPPMRTISSQETRNKSSDLNLPLKRTSDRARRFKRYGSESFVVEKRSVDPYEDFKKSMFEMIVEKQIFGLAELEELFMTFLSLNSTLHHKLIVEAFTQVLSDVFG